MGPITHQNSVSYWHKHRKHSCVCLFCDGSWVASNGYAMLKNGKYATGCVNINGYVDADGSPVTLPTPTSTGYDHPGFSIKAVVTPEAKPKSKYVFAKHAPEGGCNCHRCGMNNPHAGPNKEDGTYVCYNCR